MNLTPKKKVIALCILFAVVYCLHGVSGAVSTVYLTIQTGTFYSHSFLGWYHILTVVLVAAFYLPLAFQINRLAKEANMRILKGFSVFFMIVAFFFLTMNIIAIVVWLFNPGFFR